MNEKTARGRYPLANDGEGTPIDVPAEAVAWRVRRRSGKQGRPQCVYDPDSGAQLELPLNATIDDLREFGPGVYRLDAIDRQGAVIPNVIAQTEVTPEAPATTGSRDPYGSPTESAALIRHLVDANVRVMEAMASAFGHVRPGAPLQAPAETAEDASKAAEKWEKLFTMLAGGLGPLGDVIKSVVAPNGAAGGGVS